MPVVVYCASGYRSQIAASALLDAGFDDVSDVLGGASAWEGAGMPLTEPGCEGGAATSVPQVGARAGKALVDRGAVLLDVREADEWHAEHAPDTVLMPMGQVRDCANQLPRDRRIVVVCRSGGRSAAVTASLRAWGYDAVNLAGGMCAWAAAGLPVVTPRQAGLVVHKTEPLNCETSVPALIGGVVVPNARFYVRNHFETPVLDATTWRLSVGGLVQRPLTLSLRELQNMRSQTLVATLECAGNGRAAFDPPTPGEQWRLGAVSTAEWTGVPLVEVLDRAGLTADAVEILLRGADFGPVDGHPDGIAFERSLTIDDARNSEAVLAYAMNGEPLPTEHGYPLRLIVPSWYAVTSVKWLAEIEVIGSHFEGFFQEARYNYEWDRDGTIEREPVRLQQVRALITEPTGTAELPLGEVVVRGVAWSGAAPIAKVDVKVGDGSWQAAQLVGERRRHGWQWWELLTTLDTAGPTTVRARATDLAGRTQPEAPRGTSSGTAGTRSRWSTSVSVERLDPPTAGPMTDYDPVAWEQIQPAPTTATTLGRRARRPSQWPSSGSAPRARPGRARPPGRNCTDWSANSPATRPGANSRKTRSCGSRAPCSLTSARSSRNGSWGRPCLSRECCSAPGSTPNSPPTSPRPRTTRTGSASCWTSTARRHRRSSTSNNRANFRTIVRPSRRAHSSPAAALPGHGRRPTPHGRSCTPTTSRRIPCPTPSRTWPSRPSTRS